MKWLVIQPLCIHKFWLNGWLKAYLRITKVLNTSQNCRTGARGRAKSEICVLKLWLPTFSFVFIYFFYTSPNQEVDIRWVSRSYRVHYTDYVTSPSVDIQSQSGNEASLNMSLSRSSCSKINTFYELMKKRKTRKIIMQHTKSDKTHSTTQSTTLDREADGIYI